MTGSLLLHGCSKEDELQSGRFRDEVVGVARADHPDWPISLDPADTTKFTVAPLSIYVGNLYAVVSGMEPARRRAEIANFLGTIEGHRQKTAAAAQRSSEETFEQARSRLRIQLVPAEYVGGGADVLHRAFSEELVIAYALDEPNAYSMLTNKELGRWGVAASAVESVAIANLEDASRTIEPTIRTGRGGGFVTVSTGDSYDGARLLTPAFLDRVRQSLGPSLVMAVPRRDFLIGWTPEYGGRRDLFAETGKEFQRGPYARSRELFLASAEGVRPLKPEERSPYE